MADLVLAEYVTRVSSSAVVLLVEQRALEALGVSSWGYAMVAGLIARSASAESLATTDLAELFLGASSTSQAVLA
jgi:ABC-type branched-subunit amino acid transport system ATPase component